MPTSQQELVDLKNLAVMTAVEAGALLVSGFRGARSDVGHKSSPTDMVTEMDRQSEKLVVERLLAERPDDGVLGEEGARRTAGSGVTWVIDPLDGTTNYLYGLGPFAVSIAAVTERETLVGVVHDPLRAETFSALLGGGAFLGEEKLTCPDPPPLERALVGTGFSYSPARRRAQAKVLLELLPSVRDIRRAGAAAVDLCWVAAGRLDAYYEAGVQRWDVAAGLLVASESGAWVGALPGKEGAIPTVIATREGLQDSLLELLADAGSDEVPSSER